MNESSEKYFDWADVPQGYDWVAIDQDGSAWAYSGKPKAYAKEWGKWVYGKPVFETGKIHDNWQQLLFQRPTTEKP